MIVKRVGDERAGARASARPDRHAVRLRPFDEVGHDQEVARKLHLRDDVDLVGEALLVILDREALCRTVRVETALEPLDGLVLQLGGFEAEVLDLAQAVVAGDEARQDGLLALGPKGTADRDLDRVRQSFGKIGEQRSHLVFAFEIMLGAGAAAIVLDDVAAVGDAEERVVRLVVGARSEIAFVRRDDRQAPRIGEFEELRLDIGFFGKTVPLKLNVEPIAENLLERLRAARLRGRAGHREGPHRSDLAGRR